MLRTSHGRLTVTYLGMPAAPGCGDLSVFRVEQHTRAEGNALDACWGASR
jgi:hypothetical protein